jgi:exodeoxyribonuclease-1
MSFVFYDLETTGISPAFDQPLQFAAIHTDTDLKEIERVDLRCQIAPHIIPSPYALMVTGIKPEQLVDSRLPNFFDFTQSVMELTKRWAPSTWVGFNSIRFDEELLRQAFYQNLQPNIYATQFNGNNRLDILTAIYAVWCRNQGLLNWPTDNRGRPIYKLDRLAPENGFKSHNAHDALGDVEATLYLAQIISERDPDLWSSLLENRDKRKVMAKLETFEPVELVLRFGGGPPRSYVGCFCGISEGSATQAAFFDLQAGDPETLINADDVAIFEAVDGSPKIIRSIATNKAPALFSILNPEIEHQRKAAFIAANPAFRERVGRAMAARFEDGKTAPPVPIEKQIYGGFYSKVDQALLAEFQQADWARRHDIVGLLEDLRLRQLGRRLIAFYGQDVLSKFEIEQFEGFVHERWHAPDAPAPGWTTLSSAARAIDDLRAQPGADQDVLDLIGAFLEKMASKRHFSPSSS